MKEHDTMILDTVAFCREYRQQFGKPAEAEIILHQIAGERAVNNQVVIPGRRCFAVVAGDKISYREGVK